MNPETKICQNCKQNFTIEPEDFEFYEKMKVPPPTFCWMCRAQRRFSFRNERFIYKRESGFSGKEIIAMYPPEADINVYENDAWFSDTWDPMQYGRDVDFSRPFLLQLQELIKEVPRTALSQTQAVNSEFTNNNLGYKNCYLVFNGTHSEDCMYGNGVAFSRDSVDNSHISKCELCYGGFWLTACSNTLYSSQCEGCLNVYFSKNCIGCQNCFGCVNLRNKSYHIFNKPYSKEEYEQKLKSWDLGSFRVVGELKKQASEFWGKFPVKFIDGTKNTNVSGNYIYHSKDVLHSYLVREGENLRYCYYIQDPPNKDSMDTLLMIECEQVYESAIIALGANNIRFSTDCWPNVRDLEYSIRCGSSSNLFGCVGVRGREYCILNKQYSPEEYKELREKIILHMDAMPYEDKKGNIYRYGEFFPIDFAPFPYNMSVAQEHFPLSKSEALAQGYTWKDAEERNLTISLKYSDLPDHIKQASKDIPKDIVGCAHESACNHNCTKAFKIIPAELDFYLKMNVPLPRLCPNCRHSERIKQRNSIKLWHRACTCAGIKSENGVYQNTIEHFHKSDHCPNEFETSYASERPEIVYCEVCYQAEVV